MRRRTYLVRTDVFLFFGLEVFDGEREGHGRGGGTSWLHLLDLALIASVLGCWLLVLEAAQEGVGGEVVEGVTGVLDLVVCTEQLGPACDEWVVVAAESTELPQARVVALGVEDGIRFVGSGFLAGGNHACKVGVCFEQACSEEDGAASESGTCVRGHDEEALHQRPRAGAILVRSNGSFHETEECLFVVGLSKARAELW